MNDIGGYDYVMVRESIESRKAEFERSMYATAERQALPPEITTGLTAALKEESNDEVRSVIRDRLSKHQKKCQRRIDFFLAQLDPTLALDARALSQAIGSSEGASYLSDLGINRFYWILAVAGNGTSKSIEMLQGFLSACGEWMAANELLSRLNVFEDDLARGIQVNPWQESSRRTRSVVVHFRWASELICTSLAEMVQENAIKFAELDFLTPRSVRELFQWVEAYVKRSDKFVAGGKPENILQPQPAARRLAIQLSIESGSYASKTFRTLVSTLEIEAYPFVRFGNVIAPIALREATHNVELGLFELARRRLTNEKDRSDLFEDTVKRSLKKVLPEDMTISTGEVSIPIQNTANKGETDFLCNDKAGNVFIGECKAMAATPNEFTVINSFSDHLNTASTQLKLRMAALAAGSPLLIDGAPSKATISNIYGIAVPLHAYGGAVWNHECLPEGGIDGEKLTVIPAHQLILVARAMFNGADFASYIRFRVALHKLRIELYDELDVLAAYMFGGKAKVNSLIEGAPKHSLRMLRTYSVKLESVVGDTLPSTAGAWRRRLNRTLT